MVEADIIYRGCSRNKNCVIVVIVENVAWIGPCVAAFKKISTLRFHHEFVFGLKGLKKNQIGEGTAPVVWILFCFPLVLFCYYYFVRSKLHIRKSNGVPVFTIGNNIFLGNTQSRFGI